MHDSPVYIFDEATSNIDVESENDIMAQIQALAGKKTVILISHRLANVTAADNIYVLDHGSLAEQGTHEALLAAPISLGTVCLLLPVLAIARGVLHYAEQGCNHFIAFKLLALIRDKVFGALRQLAPAKLEGRDRGDLIAVLTADIELLEVFYAHTISPICIAVIVSAIMAAFLAGYHWLLGLYALGAYLVIGLLVPVAAAKSARRSGEEFRASFGALNGFVLDSLRGVRESLQYGDGPHRLAQINARTDELSSQERRLKLAGNRVLDVLDEQPTVREVTGGEDIAFTGAACRRVTFGYGRDVILNDVSLEVPRNSVIGITGRSGSGKSTLLKLMMRFWDTDLGKVELSGVNIKKINTASLRSAESFVEQDTVLFHDSIEENLRIANQNATHEQVVGACKKASIHDFIMTLPQGYDTPVGELGSTLSGGERQRLGVARAFLHDAPYILLDEPTSNLDSLNEAVILKSPAEERKDKTVVLVSHRASTMRIADRTYSVENGRMS